MLLSRVNKTWQETLLYLHQFIDKVHMETVCPWFSLQPDTEIRLKRYNVLIAAPAAKSGSILGLWTSINYG